MNLQIPKMSKKVLVLTVVLEVLGLSFNFGDASTFYNVVGFLIAHGMIVLIFVFELERLEETNEGIFKPDTQW